MRIKINLKAKSIQVEGKVSKTELNKVLTGYFPEGKTFAIESVTGFNEWQNPIVYDENVSLKLGEFTSIYNIEI